MKVSTEDNNFYCIIYQQGYNIRSITCYFLKRKQLYCNVSPLYEVTGDFCPYRAVQMFKLPTLLGRNRIFLPEHSSSCMLCTHLTNSLLFLFCGGSGQISVCLQSGRIRDQLSSAGSGFLCPTPVCLSWAWWQRRVQEHHAQFLLCSEMLQCRNSLHSVRIPYHSEITFSIESKGYLILLVKRLNTNSVNLYHYLGRPEWYRWEEICWGIIQRSKIMEMLGWETVLLSWMQPEERWREFVLQRGLNFS